MTQKEIEKFLADTKVYVNGRSKEIQEKLFSLSYKWSSGERIIQFTNYPFIFIHKDKCLASNNDMHHFVGNGNKEITVEQILSLELTKPSYRPFKNAEECWQEMQKHQPFGWTKHIKDRYYNLAGCIANNWEDWYSDMFNEFVFVDGTPFGIKEV